MIDRRGFVRLTSSLLAGTMLASMARPALGLAGSPPKPNILLILVDDMGFSDLSCYGGEIPTPNLDALAANGLCFSQFYNTARCSCSRASLLTGLYPHQAGLGHLEETVIPGSQGTLGRLADRCVTIAEVLKGAGYFSAITGKWHVGITHGVGPWNRGFDHSICPPMGGLYFPDQTTKNQRTIFIDGREMPTGSPKVGQGYWYASDLWVDWQEKFLDESKRLDKPFFHYLAFTAPHFPIMAPPEDVARFRGKYMEGWDVLRARRLERQKKLGVVPSDSQLPPRLPETDDWEKLTPAERDRFDSMMAVYAAAISRMDKAVGDMVASLKARGEFDNTLILFMSDNGGNAESGPRGWAVGSPLGSAHSHVQVGENWASLQNTPFSWFKRFTEEGGISTPLIAHWPKGIDAKLSGRFVREPGHLIDIMPTLLELTGAQYPATFNGHAIVPMQGRSIVPAFQGEALRRDKPLFWEHQGNRAIRDGRWKLVMLYKHAWQLFDIEQDRGEQNDLATRHPDIVTRMSAQWDEWARTSFVDQWTGPDPEKLGHGDDFVPPRKRKRQPDAAAD